MTPERTVTEEGWATIPLGDGTRGTIYFAPGNEYILQDVLLGRHHEVAKEFRVLLDALSPDDTVVDLGAHLGMFTLAAAAKGCRVIAVEASPQNVDALRRSIEANGFTNVTVVQVAISDHIGTVRFSHEGPWGRVTDDAVTATMEVPARPLPVVLDELGIARVDAIKMDIEGSEPRAIRGMEEMLTRPDAPFMVFESNAFTLLEGGMTPNHLLYALTKLGYRCFEIADPATLRPVPPDAFQPKTVTDYFAVKDDASIPASWTVGPGYSEEELAAAVAAEARSWNSDERWSIAGRLCGAPPSLRSHRQVERSLALLSLDRDHRVARATRWWRDGRGVATLAGVRDELHAAAKLSVALTERMRDIRAGRAARTPAD